MESENTVERESCETFAANWKQSENIIHNRFIVWPSLSISLITIVIVLVLYDLLIIFLGITDSKINAINPLFNFRKLKI